LKEKVFKDQTERVEENTSAAVGTAEYISPEMINDGACEYEADLWAFGCIIYQLFHNYLPFTGNSNHVIMSNIINNKMNPIDKSVQYEARDLISKLLVHNPKSRIGANRNFKALKSHPFFKDINFEALHTLESPIKPDKRKASFQFKDFIVYNKLNVEEEEIEVPHFDFEFQIEGEESPLKNMILEPIKNMNFIIYEEIVKKRSPWYHFNKRRLILFKDRLEYHDPLANTKKGDIILNKHCSAIMKDEYTFEVFIPKRTFLFKTDNKNAFTWCEKINLVIEYLKKV